ncbi:MAG: methyl-accepting chemotaxis protein [Myxococcota bacterium]|nr:methyl-accepting chemotaxis protein [Myxococcota bacterium]
MTTNPKSKLAGRHQWITLPAAIINLFLGGVLVYYCSQTLQLPEGSARRVGISSLYATAVLLPLSMWVYARILADLKALAQGKAPLDEAHLTLAARQVNLFADRQFWIIVVMWIGGTSLSAPLLHYYAGLDWGLCVRVGLNSVVIAPVGALLAYLTTVIRSRRLLSQLSELGLGYDGLARALPPIRRRLRARLMVFTAILVIAPAAITADLAISMLRRALGAFLMEASPTTRALNAAAAIDHATTAMIVLGALVLLFALAIAYAGGTSLGAPLQALAREAQRLASGDRGSLQPVPAEDELWALSCAFLALRAQTAEVLARLRVAGERISTTTTTLVEVTRESEDGSGLQAAALGATSATTAGLANAARLIADSAEQVSGAAHKTLAAAQAGQASSRAFLECTERLRGDNSALSEAVGALRSRVQKISQIVGFINGVADRADLLALNAELEGTKAGEIGRGFSLVAGEMRRVAEQVVRTTREIETLIADVQRAAQAAASATEAGQAGTRSGAQLALDLSETLDRIHGLARETSDSASSISTATEKQQSSANELAQAMSNVLKVTDLTVDTTRDMASATRGLDDLSRALGQAMDQLQVSA